MTDPEGVLEPPLATMPSTRRAILTSLKRHGELEARDLARELGLTVAAVRQQLGRLDEDGLVTHHPRTEGRGRPTHHYELTPTAEVLFPKRYGDLTTELLGYLGGPTSDRVDDLFEQRRQRRLDGARPRLAGLALGDQVNELARILDEDGYLADVEPWANGWRIVEHNCAILSVASGISAGVPERDRLHPGRPARRPGDPGGAHPRRCPRVRLRDPAQGRRPQLQVRRTKATEARGKEVDEVTDRETW